MARSGIRQAAVDSASASAPDVALMETDRHTAPPGNPVPGCRIWPTRPAASNTVPSGAEVARARHEVAEACLAHSIRDQTVAAYLRTDFLEERRELMSAWAAYCDAQGGDTAVAMADVSTPRNQRLPKYDPPLFRRP